MNTNLKKSCWIILLIFCCIFLSESVAPMPGCTMEEEQKETVLKESDRQYLKIYVNEASYIQIDIILILGCMILLFVIILERTR